MLAVIAQRYPALARALANGLHVQAAPGVAVRLRFHVSPEGRVTIPITMPQSTWNSPVGPIEVQGNACVGMHVETFARALQLAEDAGRMPQLDALIRHAQSGRPILPR